MTHDEHHDAPLADRVEWQDKLAAQERAVARRSRQALSQRITSVAGGLVLGLLLTGAVFAIALSATHRARDAAARADQAATCTNLLFGSVAAKHIDPRVEQLGCDTTAARELIERGNARDRAVAQTRAEITRDLCAVFPSLPQTLELRRLREDVKCP